MSSSPTNKKSSRLGYFIKSVTVLLGWILGPFLTLIGLVNMFDQTLFGLTTLGAGVGLWALATDINRDLRRERIGPEPTDEY